MVTQNSVKAPSKWVVVEWCNIQGMIPKVEVETIPAEPVTFGLSKLSESQENINRYWILEVEKPKINLTQLRLVMGGITYMNPSEKLSPCMRPLSVR